ncbi:MAG TPA: cupin domain-containing protein [Thermoanaerobaculia bacterium]|nr:cupin domain-containing protein [Thermoanaerobaculia bacterium]
MTDLLALDEIALLDSLIAETIEPIAPPAALKTQIVAAVRGVPQGSSTVRADEGGWSQVAKGITVKTLAFDRTRRTATLLMKFAPGSAMPEHDHHGPEQSYVVSGSCHIGSVSLRAGDFHTAPAGSHHGAVVSDEGCLLLLVVDQDDCRAA